MITIYFMESKNNFGILSIVEDASDKSWQTVGNLYC
jgi:hypothetical protein